MTRTHPLAVLTAALSLACHRAPPPHVTAAREHAPVAATRLPTPATHLSDAATAVDPAEDPLLSASWTDPLAIAMLARDCHADLPVEGPGDTDSCGGIVQQNCNPYSLCDDVLGDCQGRCTAACDTCSATCATACDRCKSTCTDAACRLACATVCGSCHASCLDTEHRCDSGECRTRVEACITRQRVRWKASHCAAECRAFRSCLDMDRTNDVSAACETVNRRECPADVFIACSIGDPEDFPR